MSEIHLYDRFQEFPLFQGLKEKDLMNIISETKLDFRKVCKDKNVVREGDKCDSLCLLLDGTICQETPSIDRSYIVFEYFTAPTVICFDSVFGTTLRYRSSVSARTDVSCVAIRRKDIVNMTAEYDTIRFNVLNTLAINCRKMGRSIWGPAPVTLRGWIERFIVAHCSYPAGEKKLKIKMDTLAEEINASRLAVSYELNAMESEGLIRRGRGFFTVPKLERLISDTNKGGK